MRIVVQRADKASVTVDKKVVASIDRGLLILVGVHKEDTEKDRNAILTKLLNLRIFPDENKNIDKSIVDSAGELLLVPQFTLYADCTKGNRPSFVQAMLPVHAACFYEDFVQECKKRYSITKTGVFGAMMKVALISNGPVTIILDSKI